MDFLLILKAYWVFCFNHYKFINFQNYLENFVFIEYYFDSVLCVELLLMWGRERPIR